MGFSQHSELRMERRSLQRLVFQLGLQSLSLGIPRFRLALLQLQPLLGVSLLGRLLPLLGLLSRLGRRPSPPPVPAAPSAQCRTPFDLSIRLGSRIEHRIDQFRRPRTGRYDQRLQKRHHDRQRQLPGRQDQQQFQFQLPRRLIVSQSRQLHLPESLFRRQQQLLPGKQFDTE